MKTKDKVLRFLESNRGQYVSGTKIAEELTLSRNAVWKAIKQLEQDGYDIEAMTRKGYKLSEKNQAMSAIGIKEQLTTPEALVPIYYYDTIDSTNKKAKELANEGAQHGTLVVANEQTSGRGRYGRSFESPKNTGIYLSVILRPDQLNFEDPTIITSYAAVVVAHVIASLTNKKVAIKWVNDLFLNGKKVCGILTEAITNFETGRIEWIVLGIGLNLSTKGTSFSPDVKKKAGAILSTDDASINRNQLVASILSELLTLQHKWSLSHIMNEYKQLSLVINKEVLIQRGTSEYHVLVKDIDEKGQLIVENEQGVEEIFNSGEIRILLN